MRGLLYRSLFLMLLLILLWFAASTLFPASSFPGPGETAAAFTELSASGELQLHIGHTMLRLFLGLLPALIMGSCIGLLMFYLEALDAALRPLLLFLSTIPKTALFPLIVLVFGLDDGSRLLTLSLVIFFQTWISVRDELSLLDDRYREQISLLGGRWPESLRYLYLPGLLPRLFTVFRIGLAGSFAVLFFTETSLFNGYGLGRLVSAKWMEIDYPAMLVGVLSGALCGWISYLLLEIAQKLLIPWNSRG